MAKRSDKLGKLEGEDNSERPSFGLNVKTPSPTKPCKLVGNSDQRSTSEKGIDYGLPFLRFLS